ncbi:MAG: acetyl-CoA carboxylase biotin carboxylase subunit, partial [Candidatus Eisenbacteria bacterium]|nr:acetyl-CoA carboxylase biotin carboxylase subunit [Candidatus Eisenbacteria bacterium]
MFTKVLVANRGEIAIRVIRALEEMGIESVAIYSEADRTCRHVRYADEAYCIGPPLPGKSYLDIDGIVSLARKVGAEAIHPGYGFLAENADFARACEDAGVTFIGPDSKTIALVGDKMEARKTMLAADIPVVPGGDRPLSDDDEIREEAERIGYPVMMKAAAGGGGKGMRVVTDPSSLLAAAKSARSEAGSAFADDRIYLEKLIEKPRHVEFQIIADARGRVLHLGERECSIQRRHQKLVEESPSPALTPSLRARMGEAAVKAAKAAGYVNAGTIEFLLDEHRDFYFLEVNARLQVEHPVTELVTGVDLVKEQLRVASGERLSLTQAEVFHKGHAIECRISAEDPENSFFPSTGVIERLREPSGPGVRVESGIHVGYEVPIYYDPLVSKLVVWAGTREDAIERMKRALGEYHVEGIKTTIPFHKAVMSSETFRSGDFDTSFV